VRRFAGLPVSESDGALGGLERFFLVVGFSFSAEFVKKVSTHHSCYSFTVNYPNYSHETNLWTKLENKIPAV